MTLLSIKEVSVALGVCPETVRRWIRREWLPAVKASPRTIRVRKDDLDRIMNNKPTEQ